MNDEQAIFLFQTASYLYYAYHPQKITLGRPMEEENRKRRRKILYNQEKLLCQFHINKDFLE